MTKLVEVNDHGLSKRMQKYPLEYVKIMSVAMVHAGFEINKAVPPYPPKPTGSKYIRTEELGRSFGSGFSGGMSGTMSIFEVKKSSGGFISGKFGSSLGYAPKVVGDATQQSPFFASYWWKFESVIGKAFPKIKAIFNKAAEKMAKFLEGKG
jgi:hypothetical protein